MDDILINVPEEQITKILTIAKRCYLMRSMPKQQLPLRCFMYHEKSGGVIAEFTCDDIDYEFVDRISKEWLKDTMVSVEDAKKLANGYHMLFKWRIRSLILYTEPRPLARYGLKEPPKEWCIVQQRERVPMDQL